MLIPHLQELKKVVDKVFPKNDCYIVGSACIQNVKPNDIDILVLIDKKITKEELRQYRKDFYELINNSHSLIFNWVRDNLELTELFPYINIKTGKKHLVNRNKMTIEEYDILKMRLYNTRYKTKRFYKEGIINE